MEQLTEGLSNETVVTICTGCYHNLRRNLESTGKYSVKMLPEIMLEAARDA
jgi:Fe-S oxidoreductase